jgi:hypothetical protein
MILNDSIIRQLAYNAGFRGSHLNAAVEISRCESGFNTAAWCNDCLGVREDSRGLWQINLNAHPEFNNKDLFEPQTNANAAYQVYLESGGNFKAWTCAKKLGLTNPPLDKNSNTILFAAAAFMFLAT